MTETVKFIILVLLSAKLVIAEDDAALNEIIQANTLFTGLVYKELLLSKNSENFLFSPISAETILALAQSGAQNDTGREIRSALQLPDDQEKIKSGFKSLLPQILRSGGQNLIHEANKIYIQENFLLKPEFKKVASEVFQADIENIKFQPKESAAEIMNQWVEEKTENRIQNLVDSDILSTRTRLILINALHFKGNFSLKFDPDLITKKAFYKSPHDVFMTGMMSKTDFYMYHENQPLGVKMLEIPFEQEDTSLVIVLPIEKYGLDKLAQTTKIDKVFQDTKFRRENVNVILPKFRIESKIDFKRILTDLGVKKAFDADEADFSEISTSKQDLYLNEILQKSFIEVNEYGVEAAAATAAEISAVYSAHFIEGTPKNFTVDHPFIFYLRIKGAIAFAGRVTEPIY